MRDNKFSIAMNFKVGFGNGYDVIDRVNYDCEQMLNKYIPEDVEWKYKNSEFRSDVYEYLERHGDWEEPIYSIVEALLNVTCNYINKTQYIDGIPSYEASCEMSSFDWDYKKEEYDMSFNFDIEKVEDEQ